MLEIKLLGMTKMTFKVRNKEIKQIIYMIKINRSYLSKYFLTYLPADIRINLQVKNLQM